LKFWRTRVAEYSRKDLYKCAVRRRSQEGTRFSLKEKRRFKTLKDSSQVKILGGIAPLHTKSHQRGEKG